MDKTISHYFDRLTELATRACMEISEKDLNKFSVFLDLWCTNSEHVHLIKPSNVVSVAENDGNDGSRVNSHPPIEIPCAAAAVTPT